MVHFAGLRQEVVGIIAKSTPTGIGIDLVDLTSPVSFQEQENEALKKAVAEMVLQNQKLKKSMGL